MTGVLVDTSVWIPYFRGGKDGKEAANALDYLLSGDEAIVNDVILSELLPFMNVRGETQCTEALLALQSPALEIDWPDIRALQDTCLRSGIKKVGLPDLIIAQQAIRLGIPLFSLDRHFTLMSRHMNLVLWQGTQK
ncbi:MAG: PIN domain-containing protein [Victivallales bacterium]|nr:PIN domain-containing protein [Victivallales bacterium]